MLSWNHWPANKGEGNWQSAASTKYDHIHPSSTDTWRLLDELTPSKSLSTHGRNGTSVPFCENTCLAEIRFGGLIWRESKSGTVSMTAALFSCLFLNFFQEATAQFAALLVDVAQPHQFRTVSGQRWLGPEERILVGSSWQDESCWSLHHFSQRSGAQLFLTLPMHQASGGRRPAKIIPGSESSVLAPEPTKKEELVPGVSGISASIDLTRCCLSLSSTLDPRTDPHCKIARANAIDIRVRYPVECCQLPFMQKISIPYIICSFKCRSKRPHLCGMNAGAPSGKSYWSKAKIPTSKIWSASCRCLLPSDDSCSFRQKWGYSMQRNLRRSNMCIGQFWQLNVNANSQVYVWPMNAKNRKRVISLIRLFGSSISSLAKTVHFLVRQTSLDCRNSCFVLSVKILFPQCSHRHRLSLNKSFAVCNSPLPCYISYRPTPSSTTLKSVNSSTPPIYLATVAPMTWFLWSNCGCFIQSLVLFFWRQSSEFLVRYTCMPLNP